MFSLIFGVGYLDSRMHCSLGIYDDEFVEVVPVSDSNVKRNVA